MVPDQIEFKTDERYSTERSVVLRYAPALLNKMIAEEDLLACSRQERMRVLSIGNFNGVDLVLVDETSGMASGTHKSLDACISIALCRRMGIRRAVFSSGANTGSALSLYGASIGLESYFFCPAGNVGRLDGALFERPSAHLIVVEGSDRRVKQAARLFSELISAPIIPAFEWRMVSAACRALFLAEQISRNGRHFDWLVQTVCAGFGPVGIYNALGCLVQSGYLDKTEVPKFLAVQQQGLSPIVQAWQKGLTSLPPLGAAEWKEDPIEPILYNTYPDQTYPMLHQTLVTWGGDATAIGKADFDRYGPEFLRRVEDAGVKVVRTTTAGEEKILQRAGLMSGVGALKAIAEGRIAKGQTVVCSLTGGAGPAPTSAATPDYSIPLDDNLEQSIARLAEVYAVVPEVN
jgi:threonine synthase